MDTKRHTSEKKKHTPPAGTQNASGSTAISDTSGKSKQMELLAELEREVLEHNAISANTLKDTIDLMLTGLEKIMPGTVGSVLLSDAETNTIQGLSAPNLPPAYSAALEGVKIGPSTGSCGTAMFTGETVIVEDIATDPLWKDYKNLALAYNLRACWSVPLMGAGNKVIGSFAMYYAVPKFPTDDEMKIVNRIARIVRIIIDNKLAEEKIHWSNTRYDLITSATNDMIWDWDVKKNTVYRNRKGLEKVFGITDNKSILTPEKWFERVHAEDRAQVHEQMDTILKNPSIQTFDMHYRFQTDAGTYNYVHDRGYVIRDANGAVLRFIGAAQNLNERKRLEQELLEQEVNKQRLIAKATIEGQENERLEIGRELHDNINQVLTTSKLLMDLALSDPANAPAMIEKSRQNVVQAINEIRRISKSLVPPSIGDLGLKAAILELTDTISLSTGLLVNFSAKGKTEVLSPAQKLTFFRIIQEQLNNIVRHADASVVDIRLHIRQALAELIITDDGKGFHLKKAARGLGLKNMSNRAEIFGGKVTIETAPGKGCRLFVSLPLLRSGKK
ncbi:MAG: GAF domain-containing protein [Chitinophagaceae bacterium]